VTEANLNLIRGTVDLLILKALSGGEWHGYAVSEWLRDATDGTLLVEEGTLYPALHRLEAKGWVEAEWGLSENNRRAKYYRLTAAGRAQLEEERRTWDLYASAVEKALTEDAAG
jgi:PadR family transcriptional regulator, regulatory protein PadR